MNISIVKGDIFESQAEFIANPVNCIGVSGGGLALEFKNRFPDGQRMYEIECKANKLRMGTVYTYWPNHENGVPIPEGNRKIIYFPTKIQPKFKSDLRGIYEGLVAARQVIVENRRETVAFPALGCGLGGLEFDRIKAAIEYVFKNFWEIKVEVYKPHE